MITLFITLVIPLLIIRAYPVDYPMCFTYWRQCTVDGGRQDGFGGVYYMEPHNNGVLLFQERCSVVSTIERFLENDDAYRSAILGNLPIYAVEMGRPEIWCQFTGRLDHVFGLTGFGASGPAAEVAKHFGFTGPQLAAQLAQQI